MKENTIRKIFVTGHRNPDIDSLASAYALAELRHRQNGGKYCALCPGKLPERARYLFDRFKLVPPESRNDVYLRAGDIMTGVPAVLTVGSTLLDAFTSLNDSGIPRLPVVNAENKYVGMLSPMNLLSHLLSIGKDAEGGLAGRMIYSSIDLIAKVIEAERLTVYEPAVMQDFKVYVAAMGVDSFETHVPAGEDRKLAVIAGDRSEIHLRVLQRRIRLLIVTGDKDVEPLIRQEAAMRQVTILRTPLDSASVIRRLKFSMPVEYFGFTGKDPVVQITDRVRTLAGQLLACPEDVFPVVDSEGKLTGILRKQDISDDPPFRVILVDHNEVEQSLPGVEELPVVEVVDHHRIGMMPTASPIKFTGDIVGSTCTLVAAMFKSAGESLSAGLGGLLLGGIVSDTLNLRSPTTSALDRRMLEWLEKISGVTGTVLMEELSRIDSPLASKPPLEVINSDRKSYIDGKYRFALSQVEETNLELLHERAGEISAQMQSIMNTEQLDFIGLLVTDAVRENSELLIFGDPSVTGSLPYERQTENIYWLPGVLSRKKQLLPQILSITAALSRN